MKQTNGLHIHSFLKIYFITISRLKFAKFLEYFKNKAEAEISKSIDIILCVRASVNTMQFLWYYSFKCLHSIALDKKIEYFRFHHAISLRNTFFKAKTAKCCLA